MKEADNKNRRARDKRALKSVEYEVGYGKPPKHGQFAEGRSGNPKGRPKNRKGPEKLTQFYGLNTFNRMLLQEAQRTVTVREGDRSVELTTMQAMLRSTAMAAIKGDRAARECFAGLLRDAARDQAKLKEEIYQSWDRYIEANRHILLEHQAKGLPIPEIFPHPDDIYLNSHTREMLLIGPSSAEEHAFVMEDRKLAYVQRLAVERAAQCYRSARSRAKKEEYLDRWHREQALFDEKNDKLPLRYKYKLEDRSDEPGASQPQPDLRLIEFITRKRPV